MNGLPLGVQATPQYLMGWGRIRGTVTRLGVPQATKVLLHHHASGDLVAVAASDAAGQYEFGGIRIDMRYYVLAIDSADPPLNAAVADLVTPEAMP